MLTLDRLEMPNHSPNFSATAAVARSPCQWNSRCSAVGLSISGSGVVAAHDGDRWVDILRPHQHIGHQIDIVEGGGVAVLGALIVGGAIDVVEHREGQATPRQLAEIGDIVTVSQPSDFAYSHARHA